MSKPALGKAAGLESEEATVVPTPAPVPDLGTVEPPELETKSSQTPIRRESKAGPSAFGLDADVTRLPSVGPAQAQKLAKLGVRSIRDLLYLLPRRYEDYSQLRTIDRLRYGEQVTIIATAWKIESRSIGDDRKMVNAVVGDGTGELMMTWFNPYVERQLQRGRAYRFGGKIDSYRGRPLMRNPKFEPIENQELHTGRITPIYPQTEGLSTSWLRKIIKHAVDAWGDDLPDFLPAGVRRETELMHLGEALSQIHFPDNQLRLEQAHRRLSFDEFFLLQLGVLGQRKRFREQTARALNTDAALVAAFVGSLPYPLTSAQQRALSEITDDLGRSQPMSRLVQGDVGSGKTVVAAAALWLAVANGVQGAIMAPTEILAEQHARSFSRMFEGIEHPRYARPVRVALFTGSMERTERAAALADLAEGEIDIAVGTHALIQEGVTFRELAVAVVDEQHRFGVEQRAALRQKGVPPHVLVMSATPIPRSLALTLYGDLDVSVIDEMPPNRIPIKTKWLTSAQRERAYAFIRRQVAEGRQAFIIYPLVEEGANSDETPDASYQGPAAAVEEHERLSREVFPELRLGLLHGRLKGDAKEAVMRAFSAGELNVLVATSVVEVGIDVPNATVMVIEGAERFGLAQLHQFRGRVGRGPYPSYCILLSDAAADEGARRLQAMETNDDGFALAQIDLEMRGPGDFFGTRQSGLPPLQTAELADLRTLELARAMAQRVYAEDPQFSHPDNHALAERVAAFWTRAADLS
jgi:ATP-dependent DNA helicase RecG